MEKGPGNIYYSAAQTEQEMHPLIELGQSAVPYLGIGAGAAYMMSQPYSPGSKYTAYDILQAQVRNISSKTPLGFGNTFRFSEFMSPFLSIEALGLTKETGDAGKTFGSYKIQGGNLNEETIKYIKAIVGEEAFAGFESRIVAGRKDYQLVYSQEEGVVGRGNLYFEELKELIEYKGDRTTASLIETGERKLISKDVALMHGSYSADTFDLLIDQAIARRINPAAVGVAQALDLDIDLKKLFLEEDKETGKFILIPSVEGSLENAGDLKRRTAYLSGYLNMGSNRFNRLIAATVEQVPILGAAIDRFARATGFDLRTKPAPFYKQYFSLGLKTAKIGAAFLGLQTIDHYREKFGVMGNLVASAGISAGVAAAYARGFPEKTASLAPGKVGAFAFAAQMILPGFDKGLIEGGATTLANLHIGMSYIGQYTGLSFIKRGFEGIFPGFTEPTTGLMLGLGVAAASYAGYGTDYFRGLIRGDDSFKSKAIGFFERKMRDKFGFEGMQFIQELPAKANELRSNAILSLLTPSADDTEAGQRFRSYNPLAEKLLQDESPHLDEYMSRLKAIVGDSDLGNLNDEQLKKLKNFFSDNENLVKDILDTDDLGEVKIKIANFENMRLHVERSEIFKSTDIFNKVNQSLLNRIYSINEKYKEDNGIFGRLSRRLEIFGAEIYHSFFGASMSGSVMDTFSEEAKRSEGGSIESTYDAVAKNLNASPIVKRFGSLVLGTAFMHQMVTSGFFGMLQKPEDIKAEYSGEKLVEIKKGRWWEAGGTPYEGGETSYFRPHAYAMLMANSKEKSVWGDDAENFNPITKFFLKNFTYYLEDKNYYDRPYPMSGTAFEDIPVIGKVLGATIGRLIKPPKLMHEDEIRRLNPETGEVEYAYEAKYGSAPELGELPGGPPKSPYSPIQMLGAIQYQTREIEGLTGYAKNVLQKVFTGREVLGTRDMVYETSTEMDSPINNYWEAELGGFGFTSEPIRRLFPRPRAEIEKYNPVLNSMPYYIPSKLKRGDPYRKIDNGSARLPGKGYEALNPELQGMSPEDYPDIHKYKILSDVDPTSRKTVELHQSLMERKAAGILTEHESKIFDRTVEQHQKKIAGLQDNSFDENAIKIPYLSDYTGAAYRGLTELIRKSSAPIENLIPGGFRPTQKLLGHTRDAIEVYEMERVYNTSNSFWDAPVRDWFRPAFYSAANVMGWEGKPGYVEKREELSEHFDKLQFIKYMNLAQTAENPKDRKRYLGLAAKTRTGVNPNGDALSIYLSLPNSEKKFFDAFMKAQADQRDRIMELVPEDQKHLYEAVWSRIDAGEEMTLHAATKPVIDEEYMNEQYVNLEQYFRDKPLPGVDWIGWNKDVDIEDIKVKYVSNIGAEIHDYDVWESQVRNSSRKPYLEGADMFMYEEPLPTRNSMRNRIVRGYKNMGEYDMSKSLINTSNAPYGRSHADIFYNDRRESELGSLINLAIRG